MKRITRSNDLVENRHLTDKDEVENAVKLGEYFKKRFMPTPLFRSE
jgi:hypothetical protein